MAFTNDDDSKLEDERNMDSLLMNAIEENENLQKKIISLKIEREEAKRREDFLNIKLKEKDDICEKREAEIMSLRKKLEQIKRSWQSSLTLDNILNTQRPQLDKSGIGFKGESSSTKNNARSYADVLSCHPKEEKSSQEKGRISKPRFEERATPRKNVDSSYGYYNRYQTIFLGH